MGVFRNPEGAPCAPTAAPQPAEILAAARGSAAGSSAGEVQTALLTDTAVVMLLSEWIVVTRLDASVKCASVARPPVSRDRMPLNIDPNALLRMLDMHGED